MWDISKIKNYRMKYKRYYGIEFGSEYVVHHMDFNRENNDIENLLLLPKELHTKYHMIISALSCGIDDKSDGIIDCKLCNQNITYFNATLLDQLPDTINECRMWLDIKRGKYERNIQIQLLGGEEICRL